MKINNLRDKKFKETVIKMLTELRKRIEEQSENFKKELENIKNNQLELKNTIIEMKNTLEGINSRLIQKNVCDMDDRIVEITQSEQQKEKQNFLNEDSLRDLWYNIKCTNIHIIGVTEGDEREKGTGNVLVEVVAENFPNLKKETDIQVQEAQRFPNKIHPKISAPRYIIKMAKFKGRI